jgi:hypothetical protein
MGTDPQEWERGKKLALISELFWTYMEPLCRVSRGKAGEADTRKRDYRYHCGRLWIEEVGCTLGLVRPPYAGLGMDEKVIPVHSRRRV